MVADADRALFETYVNVVAGAPGPALLAWGDDAICVAYNRAYRTLAGFRGSVLGKPLTRAQPEIERAFRSRVEQTRTGQSVALPLEGAAMIGVARLGWLMPVLSTTQRPRGVVVLVLEVTPAIEPVRRVIGAVAGDLRDALVGVRVVTERLARAPKLTPERLAADLGRVIELTGAMERTADDLSMFSRFAGGTGVQVNPRPHDLGVLVRAACDDLGPASEPATSSRPGGAVSTIPDSGPPSTGRAVGPADSVGSPSGSRSLAGLVAGLGASGPASRPGAGQLRVSVAEVRGAWDPEAIRRVVGNLVSVARKHAVDASEVRVDLATTVEGAVLAVRGDGRGARDEELTQLLDAPAGAPGTERRRPGSNLALLIARELVAAHGGRLVIERAGANGFVFRAIFPLAPGVPVAAIPPRRS